MENGSFTDLIKSGKHNLFKGLTAALLSVVILAGCSRPGLPGLPWSKPTAVSLTGAALRNLQEVQSLSMHMDSVNDLAVTYEALDISMNLGMKIGMDMDMIKDPQLAKGSAEVEIDAVGQKQSMQGDFYLDPAEGENGMTYIRWSGGEWLKKEAGKKTASQEAEGSGETSSGDDGQTSSGEGGTSSAPGFPSGLLEGAGILKLIAEQAMDAELLEETTTVNDQEAWEIHTDLQGSLLKEMLQKSGGSLPFDTASVRWDEVTIPSQIYIYKESELPARIVLDCTDLGTAAFGEFLTKATQEFPLGNLRTEIAKSTLDLTFSRYDEIETFEIPQEARQAVLTDNLLPGITDLLEGLN